MKLRKTLLTLYKYVGILSKLLPTLIDLLQDLADDGVRNKSNRTTRSQSDETNF